MFGLVAPVCLSGGQAGGPAATSPLLLFLSFTTLITDLLTNFLAAFFIQQNLLLEPQD
jgi:hypothetical protein